MENKSSDSSPQWELFSDDFGNFYFYNHLTGESSWTVPDEGDEIDGDQIDDSRETSKNEEEVIEVNPTRWYADEEIAIGVAEVMLSLVSNIEAKAETKSRKKKRIMSDAALRRYAKNQEKQQASEKRTRLQSFSKYTKVAMKCFDKLKSADPSRRKGIGEVFTASDAVRWDLDRCRHLQKQRRRFRKGRKEHTSIVRCRLLRHQLLRKIQVELSRQLLLPSNSASNIYSESILYFDTPQLISEAKQRLQNITEPEIAERLLEEEDHLRSMRKDEIGALFDQLDTQSSGCISIVEIMSRFAVERKIQETAPTVRAVSMISNNGKVQKALINIAARLVSEEKSIDRNTFEDFLEVVEQVVDHAESIHEAVKEAEMNWNEDKNVVCSGKSKLAAKLERTTKRMQEEKRMQENEQHKLLIRTKKAIQNENSRWITTPDETWMEEWELNHHHRYIQTSPVQPLYCCLCRRKKWEIARRDEEQYEADYRMQWQEILIQKLNEKHSNCSTSAGSTETASIQLYSQGVEVKESNDSQTLYTPDAAHYGHYDSDVLDVIRALVYITENIATSHDYTMNQALGNQAPLAKKKKRKKKKKALNLEDTNARTEATDIQSLADVLEKQEGERKTMYAEEVATKITLEKLRRREERSALQVQDLAHRSLTRILEYCPDLSPFIRHLRFRRCLKYENPLTMVAQVTNSSDIQGIGLPRYYLLRIFPCKDIDQAQLISQDIMYLRKYLTTCFVMRPAYSSYHQFQQFSDSGIMIESVPIVFVIYEYAERGRYIDTILSPMLHQSASAKHQTRTEKALLDVFRDIAAGLAAVHSLGKMHLNIKLSNMYVLEDRPGSLQVKLGYPLHACHPVSPADIDRGYIEHHLQMDAYPPEVQNHTKLSDKTDVWMLGRALLDAMMLWKSSEFKCEGMDPRLESFHAAESFTIANLMDQLPMSASNTVRSLLRMMLQPMPSQRPNMSQVLDFISFS